MNHVELLRNVSDMLGFRVTERENDAVVEFLQEPELGQEYDRVKVRAVRPANREEVAMFLRILGLVARNHELLVACGESDATLRKVAEEAKATREALGGLEAAVKSLGMSLQGADYRIKELMVANRGLGEERDNLQNVCDGMLQSMEEMGRELTESTEQLASMTDKANAAAQTIESLQAELAKEKANADFLGAEVNRLRAEKGSKK